LRQEIDRLEREHDPDYIYEGIVLDLTEQIAARLIDTGMRRSELAERLGTSRAYVTKLLDGQENMTLKTLVRVANALEMKVETKFIPRERAAKPAKKQTVKTAIGPKMRGPLSSKKAVPKRVAAAARSRK
jgi:transcriptional regulator with XRE-family HTH domain